MRFDSAIARPSLAIAAILSLAGCSGTGLGAADRLSASLSNANDKPLLAHYATEYQACSGSAHPSRCQGAVMTRCVEDPSLKAVEWDAFDACGQIIPPGSIKHVTVDCSGGLEGSRVACLKLKRLAGKHLTNKQLLHRAAAQLSPTP